MGAAIEVHKELGPGLLESVYQKCMKRELSLRNLNFISELAVNVSYKGVDVNADLRCDFLVEDVVVVELKAIDALAPIHDAQILTYMKLLQKPKGLLINFNSTNIQENGYKAFVNEYYKILVEA